MINFGKNIQGQSTVEYIMLFAVLAALAFGVFNNGRMKDFLGPDSKFFKKLANRMEYSYKHTQQRSDLSDSTQKPSLWMDGGGDTRFFLSTKNYPE